MSRHLSLVHGPCGRLRGLPFDWKTINPAAWPPQAKTEPQYNAAQSLTCMAATPCRDHRRLVVHDGEAPVDRPDPTAITGGRNGVVGTSLHRFLLRFRLRWVTSGTSVGTSTGSDGSGALACRLEWRSIHTQNPRKTAVMASTATVAGSIVFSSGFDSPKPALLFTHSSVRWREGTFLDHSSFHLAPFVRYRAIAPFGQLETSTLSIREFRSMMPAWNG
jgi:hypothetical protein